MMMTSVYIITFQFLFYCWYYRIKSIRIPWDQCIAPFKSYVPQFKFPYGRIRETVSRQDTCFVYRRPCLILSTIWYLSTTGGKFSEHRAMDTLSITECVSTPQKQQWKYILPIMSSWSTVRLLFYQEHLSNSLGFCPFISIYQCFITVSDVFTQILG